MFDLKSVIFVISDGVCWCRGLYLSICNDIPKSMYYCPAVLKKKLRYCH